MNVESGAVEVRDGRLRILRMGERLMADHDS